MLVRVLYVSAVSDGVASGDIERLVANSRRRNRQLDLTGALLVCDRKFAQVLEGRDEAVDDLLRQISLDSRHHGMVVHDRSPITLRLFPEWDMAFIESTRCNANFRDMLGGRLKPNDFMDAMAAWIEQHKAAPY